MTCYVIVEDGRCSGGISTRSKKFDTLVQCENWVKSLKNRLVNDYRVLDNGVAKSYRIGDNE